MCRTGMCRFGIGNWIFLVLFIHLFTYAKGGEEGPPEPGVRFTVEPADAVVLPGRSVLLPCAAAAPRPARLAWRHSAGAAPTRDQTLTAGDQHRRVLSNGSLVLEDMSAALAGQYQCAATVDGVGTIVSRPATVFLAEVPPIQAGPRVVVAVVGGVALLPCAVSLPPRLAARLAPPAPRRRPPAAPAAPATPDLQLNVTWLRNGVAVSPEAGRVSLVGTALELEPVTRADAARYRCRLALAGDPRRHSLGEEIELRVSADEATEYPPRFVAAPQSATVLEGASVIFDCAATGNPKPQITWLNNGVEIDLNDLDSRMFRWGCGSLLVAAVRPQDAGRWTCRASSSLDVAERSAALTVLTPPRAVSPASVAARALGAATLPCAVRGRPAPSVRWLKDGDPLTPNHHDFDIIDGSSLRIQGVLGVDAGMFQCEAASAAGAAAAAVRLTVLPPADGDITKNGTNSSSSNPIPKIKTDFPHTKKSSKNAKSPIHKNSTQDIFNSLVSSGPYDDQMPNFDYDDEDFLGETSPAFTSGPDLEFDYNLGGNDFDYFHAAEGFDLEQLNSANASIISAPKDLKAVIVKHRFITLSWQEPDVINENITGYAVIYKVKDSDRRRVSLGPAARREANVAHLRPNTTYQLWAAARAHAALSPPSEVLEVTTLAEEGEEEAAGNLLRAEPAAPRSLRLRFPPDAARPTAYPVTYTEMESGAEHSAWVPVTHTEDGAEGTLGGLRDGAWYWVRWAGGAAARARTAAAAPAAPAAVSAAPASPQSIVVRWQPPLGPARALTGYKVRYRAVAASRRKADVAAAAADATHVEIRGLQPDTAYQVRVCALSANGTSPFSEWVTAATPPAPRAAPGAPAVPAAPPPLVTRAGRDWISVWWSEEGSSGSGGPALGWVLGWGLGVPDESSVELSSALHSHVIKGLESNAEYVISLRGSNALGLGPAVYATVRTRPALGDDALGDDLDDLADLDEEELDDEDEDSGPPDLLPPVGLKVIMLSGTTAVVYWTDPTLPRGQTATDGRRYVVRWSAAGGGRARAYNASDLNCMLDELRPSTTYDFQVKLIKGGRESQWSMIVSNTTLEAAPGSPPRDVRVQPAPDAPYALDVSWAPPARPNGRVTGYVVTYALRRSEAASGAGGASGASGAEEWAALSVGGAALGARLERLRPDAAYLVRVQAATHPGLGPPSLPVPARTERGPAGSGGVAGSAWLWAAAGGALCVLALAAALALSLCCRRTPPASNTSYQKASASIGIKPPDLWIHHDQMELKHLDTKLHASASKISASSSDGLALAQYEPPRPQPASLDRRHLHAHPTYVDGRSSRGSDAASRSSASTADCRRCDYRPMTGAGCAATCERRRMPLPDQGPALGVGAGTLGSPAPSLGSLPAPLLATLPHPHAHSHAHAHAHAHAHPHTHPHLTPTCGGAACTLDTCARAARERGHYVAYEPLGHYAPRDSLSSDTTLAGGALPGVAAGVGPGGSVGGVGSVGAPCAGSVGSSSATGPGAGGSLRRGFLDSTSEHSTPSHSRAGSGRDTSPYKKSASSSPGHLPNRLLMGSSVTACAAELEPLTPSRSTERLQREMQNLEGLMKDLSAITQHQFHC